MILRILLRYEEVYMKGRVSVFIRENGKVVKTLHKDNLVTGAVDEYYHRVKTGGGDSQNPYGSSSPTDRYFRSRTCSELSDPNGTIYPVETSALGGILLFDGQLPTNPAPKKLGNVMQGFPHLVGFANQTSYDLSYVYKAKQMGLLDRENSGEIETGHYRHVWKWSGEQLADIPISSIALTNAVSGGSNIGPFCDKYTFNTRYRPRQYYHYSNLICPFQTNYPSGRLMYFDESTGYAYLYDNLTVYTTDPMPFRIKRIRFRLNTTSATYQGYEWVYDSDETLYSTTIIPEDDSWVILHNSYPSYGHDGYIYVPVAWKRDSTTSKYTKLKYAKISISDFTQVSFYTADLPDISIENLAYATGGGCVIMNGYIYTYTESTVEDSTAKAIRVKIADGSYDMLELPEEYASPTEISQTLGGNIMLIRDNGTDPDSRRSVECRLLIHGDFTNNLIEYCNKASMYEGEQGIILKEVTDTNTLLCCPPHGNVSSDNYNALGGFYAAAGYLGTIFNLDSPITIAYGQDLVVQYDLITTA